MKVPSSTFSGTVFENNTKNLAFNEGYIVSGNASLQYNKLYLNFYINIIFQTIILDSYLLLVRGEASIKRTTLNAASTYVWRLWLLPH